MTFKDALTRGEERRLAKTLFRVELFKSAAFKILGTCRLSVLFADERNGVSFRKFF